MVSQCSQNVGHRPLNLILNTGPTAHFSYPFEPHRSQAHSYPSSLATQHQQQHPYPSLPRALLRSPASTISPVLNLVPYLLFRCTSSNLRGPVLKIARAHATSRLNYRLCLIRLCSLYFVHLCHTLLADPSPTSVHPSFFSYTTSHVV